MRSLFRALDHRVPCDENTCSDSVQSLYCVQLIAPRSSYSVHLDGIDVTSNAPLSGTLQLCLFDLLENCRQITYTHRRTIALDTIFGKTLAQQVR